MSEGTQPEAVEQEAATKRKTLSLGERIKVVDYLRSRVEPVVADSNAAVAAMVSDATKVEINWQQLKYMIDDPTMAEYQLGSKVHVKLLGPADELQAAREQLTALEGRVQKLEAVIVNLSERFIA